MPKQEPCQRRGSLSQFLLVLFYCGDFPTTHPQGEEPHSCHLPAPLKRQKNTTQARCPRLFGLGTVRQSTKQLQFSAEINIKCQLNAIFTERVGWRTLTFDYTCIEKAPRMVVAHSQHLFLPLNLAVNWNSIAMFLDSVEVRRLSEILFKLTLIQTGSWPLTPGRNSTPVEISLSPFQLY